MTWKTLAFNDLTLQELYDIMVLRQVVFIVEQNCPYLDADGNDQKGFHVLGYDNDGDLVAYTRLLPVGVSYIDAVSIGRVISSKKVRGQGIGQELMRISIQEIRRLFGNEKITISAQCYLIKFYESFGFKTVGESYLEDDIPHIKMKM
ncbi:MAG: GNAT family N-acetyltransferase [Saprospiraceae bacterium]|nr:GNAT family N-acetyltransferase [Saprospiraceae bacterium]